MKLPLGVVLPTLGIALAFYAYFAVRSQPLSAAEMIIVVIFSLALVLIASAVLKAVRSKKGSGGH
jgi:hypothetical protein